MRRLLYFALLVLVLCPAAFCQSTTVSGTITDAGSQNWNYGTYSFTFQPVPGNPGPYFLAGSPFNVNQTISGNLSNVGAFSVSVPSTTSITPAGTTWLFQVCPAATSPCYGVPLTVTGATQSVTGNVIPPAASVSLTNPPAGVTAYSDAEITGAKPGSFYFNITDNTLHVCSQTGFPPCTWISVGATSSILPSNNTWTGTNNFTAATTLGGGGSLSGTFSGTPTLSNLWTFSGGITGTGSVGALTVPVANIVPGINGQYVQTVGGVAAWSSLSPYVQLVGIDTGLHSFNAATTSLQSFPSTYTFSAGQLNATGKTFDIEFSGGPTLSTAGTTTTVELVFGGTGYLMYSTIPATASGNAGIILKETCSTTATGATGAIQCFGSLTFVDSAGSSKTYQSLNLSLSSVDLTASKTAGIGFAFSTSSSSNIGTQLQALVHQQN